MPVNRISASMNQAQADEVTKAIETINQNLPFLIDLTTGERQDMPKFGNKNRTFVVKALELAKQNPDILPRSFDVEEMKKDVELVEKLYPIHQAMTKLFEKIDDTYFAAGSEAYTSALHVYNYAKAANIAMGVLDDVLDDLGKRFARKSKPAEEKK